jgi:hypothetical protein
MIWARMLLLHRYHDWLDPIRSSLPNAQRQSTAARTPKVIL